jgi:hypothetical protein
MQQKAFYYRAQQERVLLDTVVKKAAEAGFQVTDLYDGEEWLKFATTPTPEELAQVAFATEAVQVVFNGTQWVYFVWGNGVDAATDWGIGNEAFAKAVEEATQLVYKTMGNAR